MPNTPSTSFRFSPELLKRLDRYAARLTRQSGVPRPVSRAAAAEKLLTIALAAEESRSQAEQRGRK
ncbi:MAG TPA: hypothetical protein VII08_19490 [Myxococcales bacterium]